MLQKRPCKINKYPSIAQISSEKKEKKSSKHGDMIDLSRLHGHD